MKILVADDSLAIRVLLKELVSSWGYEPVLAEDGDEAWKEMQVDDPPQLLLIDWEMPGLSGLELCQRIRQQDSSRAPYILILTGRKKTSDIVNALAAGANDHVAKPFQAPELQARLQVGERVLGLQEELNRSTEILAEEREVIENTILSMQAASHFQSENVRQLQIPVEKVSGDILMSAYRPDGTHHIILGDFTGHGLAAAIGGPIIYNMFYRMTANGLSMDRIADEVNHYLCEMLPTGKFLSSVFVEFNQADCELKILNCGMEDVLIFRDGAITQRVSSTGLPMGILDKPLEKAATISVEEGDLAYMYTDGISETTNDKGEEFGTHRLEQALIGLQESGDNIEQVIEPVKQFRGDLNQQDDITLLELLCSCSEK